MTGYLCLVRSPQAPLRRLGRESRVAGQRPAHADAALDRFALVSYASKAARGCRTPYCRRNAKAQSAQSRKEWFIRLSVIPSPAEREGVSGLYQKPLDVETTLNMTTHGVVDAHARESIGDAPIRFLEMTNRACGRETGACPKLVTHSVDREKAVSVCGIGLIETVAASARKNSDCALQAAYGIISYARNLAAGEIV